MDLFELWAKQDENELADFIRLLNYSNALRAKMKSQFWESLSDDVPDQKNQDDDDIENFKKEAFTECLEKVEKDNLYKLLLKDGDFRRLVQWLDTGQGKNSYDGVERRLKLLESIIIPYTVYARSQTGVGQNKRIDKKLEKSLDGVSEQAKKFLEEMDHCLDNIHSEPYIKAYLSALSSHIEFLSQSHSIKKINSGTSYKERQFLLDTIKWLLTYGLEVRPALLKRACALLKDKTFSDNDKKLNTQITKCKEIAQDEIIRYQKFKRMLEVQ